MDASDSSPPSRLPGVDDLRQGGILSRRLPGYQERPAQIEMAMVVAEALATSRHALIEAPTGVGKSLAYLVPLARSGKRAIISTANKALQEQLFYKDIPFVQEYVQHFDASLYKGVNNYLCLDRLAKAFAEGLPDTEKQVLRQIVVEIKNLPSYTGDFDQLPIQIPPELRGRINGDSDQCAWNKCRHFGDCYIHQRSEQAQRAQIIVVNHTLLLLDVATGGAILPSHEVIVLDEAHHLEEETTRACATSVRYTQVTNLLADPLLQAHAPLKLWEEVMVHAASTWQQLEQQISTTGANTMTLQQPVPQALDLAKSLSTLSAELEKHPPQHQTEQDEIIYQKLVQRTRRLADRVRMVFDVKQPDVYVYVLKRESTPGRHVPSLEGSATPLDVAPWLRERLFDKWPVIIGVSATLATVSPTHGRSADTAPSLAYYKKRVGIEKHKILERILPLPYDYLNRALLYVPRDLPKPAYEDHQAAHEYMQAVAERMRQLVTISGGRAFLLFTSQSMLRQVSQTLEPDLPYPLLRQGDLPRAELIHRFKSAGNAVLCGLRSFWEGVDIPGEALSLVIIDRLPFHPPDDPVHEARIARMIARKRKNKDEEDWFMGYVLPQAVLQLKQGIGRLLRSDNDRGVIAILDSRLHTEGYGKSILHALPPARLVTSIGEVERFFTPPPPQERREDHR